MNVADVLTLTGCVLIVAAIVLWLLSLRRPPPRVTPMSSAWHAEQLRQRRDERD